MILYFENKIQAALWKHELLGQISDGYWENATPWNHWQHTCEAEVRIDATDPRRVGYKSRSYALDSRELLEYVGERMLALINMIENGVDEMVARDYCDYSWRDAAEIRVTVKAGMTATEIFDAINSDYWVEKQTKLQKYFATQAEFEASKTGHYTMTDLRRELKRMKQIHNDGELKKAPQKA